MTAERAPESDPNRVDLAPARAALAAAAERTAHLLRSLPDLQVRVPRSEWKVEDAAAHLTIAPRAYTDSAQGNPGPWADLTPELAGVTARVAALNRLTIATEPRRDPAAAARAVVEGTQAFLATTAGMAPDAAIATPWYGPDLSLSVAQATCLLLGEQVVHGYDIARAARRRWPIRKDDARLVFVGLQAMMPLVVRPELARERSTFQIHLGRSSGFFVQIHDGQARVTHRPPGAPVDCHVAADPVALMLVGYGRISQWRAIAKLQLITWGRKPWLAFRLVGFFANP